MTQGAQILLIPPYNSQILMQGQHSPTFIALLQEYQICLQGTITKDIKKAQKHIKALQTDQEFLNANVDIIVGKDIDYNIRKLAVVQFSNYSKRITSQDNHQNMKKLSTYIFQLFIHTSLEFPLKILLLKPAKQLLSSIKLKQIRETAIIQVSQSLQQSLQSNSKINYQYFILCAKLFLSLRESMFKINNFIVQNFKVFSHLGVQLIAKVSTLTNAKQLAQYLTVAYHYAKVIKQMLNKIRLLDQSTNQLLQLQELANFVMRGIDLNLPINTLDTPLIMFNQDHQQLTSSFNTFKILLITLLQLYMRTSNSFIREPQQINQCTLIKGSHTIIQQSIRVLIYLLSKGDIFLVPFKSRVLEGVEVLLRLLICGTRLTQIYYSIFLKYKIVIIQEIIMKCLALTEREVLQFTGCPEEFAEKALYVVKRQSSEVLRDKMVDEDQNQDQDKILKAVAADCLISLCQYQDGVVFQLYQSAIGKLKDKSGYPKYILFQVMVIAKYILGTRPDISTKVIQMLTQLSTEPVPLSQTLEHNINFSYYLILAASMIKEVKVLSPKLIINLLNQSHQAILTRQPCLVYLAYEVFQAISQTPSSMNSTEVVYILKYYQEMIKTQTTSVKLLNSYYKVLKHSGPYLENNKDILIEGQKQVGQHLLRHLQEENRDRHFIHLCFNILSLIGQNQRNLPQLIVPIQQTLQTLIPYICCKSDFDFQSDIFSLLKSFICHNKAVSLLEMSLLKIIPEVYFRQYLQCFGEAFQTIQVLLFYGSDILNQDEKYLMSLIQLGFNSMDHPKTDNHSQLDSCQGVLILQSLVLACGRSIPPFMWKIMAQKLIARLQLQNINFFLTANLLALQALILLNCQQTISQSQGSAIMSQIIRLYSCVKRFQYAPKVMIACLSSSLTNPERKFISDNFQSILKIIVQFLLSSSLDKSHSNLIEQQFEDQEESYREMLKNVKNNMKELDQFQYFKQKLMILKNGQKLKDVIQKLDPIEKDFLSNMLRTERVQKAPRVIYRTKRE